MLIASFGSFPPPSSILSHLTALSNWIHSRLSLTAIYVIKHAYKMIHIKIKSTTLRCRSMANRPNRWLNSIRIKYERLHQSLTSINDSTLTDSKCFIGTDVEYRKYRSLISFSDHRQWLRRPASNKLSKIEQNRTHLQLTISTDSVINAPSKFTASAKKMLHKKNFKFQVSKKRPKWYNTNS